MFTGNNIIDFITEFSNEVTCQNYLAEMKWKNGFICTRCGHTGWARVGDTLHRKCNRCKHIESPTAGTLFHKVKFPMPKAFLLVFLVSTSKKGISSYELSRRLSLRQTTCYFFKRKVVSAMNIKEPKQLEDKVDVDEFFIGGPQRGKRGRSKGKKKEVVMGIQMKKGGIIRCYAKQINGAGTKELKPFFQKFINKVAVIRTDKWRGYRPLKHLFPWLNQQQSLPLKNFRLFHRQVMMLKAWLRGTHHKAKFIQPYLDEFTWRFNNRFVASMFDLLLSSMMNQKHIPIKNLNFYWGA